MDVLCSSDSENDNVNNIQEAIDHEFINNILVKVKGDDEKNVSSLRPQPQKTFINELNVTPEFQKHIAKHLDVIIKRQIKEVSCANGPPNSSTGENVDGIRMFSRSKVYIRSKDLEPETPTQHSCRRRKKIRKSSSTRSKGSDECDDELERLRSAAVSPEWVLLKKGAYGKCCEKGKIIRLMDKGGGHLVEIMDKGQHATN